MLTLDKIHHHDFYLPLTFFFRIAFPTNNILDLSMLRITLIVKNIEFFLRALKSPSMNPVLRYRIISCKAIMFWVMIMSKKLGFSVAFSVLLLLTYVWITRFGFSVPPPTGHLPLLKGDAWFLVVLGVAATAVALVSLFLEFRLSRSVTFVGWVLYFPVLFNVLVPMFILFFSMVGVFYTPWLILTDLPLANKIINGIIRLPNNGFYSVLEYLGYALIAAGLTVYSIGLYQLLSHVTKKRTLLTEGLYAVVRHPQYLGIFMWTLGFAISGWRLINYLMWLTLCYSYVLLAEHEETELDKKFGKEYALYKGEVPFMIPYLKVDLRPITRMTSRRNIRLLIYTALYIALLTACYCIIEPHVVLYR